MAVDSVQCVSSIQILPNAALEQPDTRRRGWPAKLKL